MNRYTFSDDSIRVRPETCYSDFYVGKTFRKKDNWVKKDINGKAWPHNFDAKWPKVMKVLAAIDKNTVETHVLEGYIDQQRFHIFHIRNAYEQV